jgi:hypothetical protein
VLAAAVRGTGESLAGAAAVGLQRLQEFDIVPPPPPRVTGYRVQAKVCGPCRFLTLMVPGGLEEMFFELADLPPDSITDPAVRAAISARHDSIPA